MLGYLVSTAKHRVYNADYKDGVFYFTIRAELLDYISSLEIRPEILESFSKIRRTKNDNCVTFVIGEDSKKSTKSTSYSSSSQKRGTTNSWAAEINLLLTVLNFVSIKSNKEEMSLDLFFQDKKPLLVIETAVEAGSLRAYPLVIGISTEGREIIKQKYPQGATLGHVNRVMLETWKSYSYVPWRDRDMYRSFYQSTVRECGTPSFVVPGNCACLGNNPDEYWESGELTPHNMDVAPQQLTMLAMILAFSKEVFGNQ